MTNNIAIVGTRGAGKTVFTTVLAHHLSTPKGGVLLIPRNFDVAEYVELNYAKLQRGEWLDSTNMERKLSWKLRIRGKEDQEMTLLDCPGEDIQRLFARRDFENEQSTDSKKDKDLVEYLLGASKVLLLINLKDFIDESFEEEDVRRRKLREHSLKEFLSAIKQKQSQQLKSEVPELSSADFQLLGNCGSGETRFVHDGPRHIAVVFTAFNQYQEEIEKKYGSVPAFLSKRLPALYYEHFAEQDATGILVSAVAETDQNGCPQRGFRSVGLNTVTQWLTDPVLYAENRGMGRQNHKSQFKQEGTQSANEPKMHEW